MRISLISLDQKWHDKNANINRCEEILAESLTHGSELVIFPEMTLTGYSLDLAMVCESESNSVTLKSFSALAKKYGIPIVFGACIFNSVTKKPRNQFCLALANGDCNPIYAKMHPFSFSGEDKILEAGNSLGFAQIGDLRFGAAVCYDLRFPELYAAMAPSTNAVITIANWPAARVEQWRALLIARAIESQSFMLGVNRIGADGNGLEYQKSTLVVSPNGNVLNPMSSSIEIDIYELDLHESLIIRDQLPSLRDKRYDLYRNFQVEKNA
jgi:omega-amidase